MTEVLSSRRNRPDLRSKSKSIRDIVRILVFEYAKNQNIKRYRKLKLTDLKPYFQQMENIILDVYSAWLDDSTKFVGYSRGKSNFLRGGAYWDHASDRPLLTYTAYRNSVDYLAAEGLIENHVANAGKDVPYSSRMRASPKLIDLLVQGAVSWADIGFDPEACAIVVKDENKRPIAPPEDPNFDLETAEANLRQINENLLSSLINLHVTDQAVQAIRRRAASDRDLRDDDTETHGGILEFSDRRLRRIFANGTFSAGGRFYGGWWQGLPSEYRKYIEIDGAVTVELDYSTIQPRILYAQADAEPPEDAYRIPGWDEDLRPTIKKAFNQLVNSSERIRSPGQWRLLAPSIEPDPLPEGWHDLDRQQATEWRRREFAKLTGRTYDELLGDLLEMHEPISKFFFSRSWTWLQRMDSDIAELVMLRMLDFPFTVLPVHDSFIVRRGGEGALMQVMEDAFGEIVGVDAMIDRNDALFPSPYERVSAADRFAHMETLIVDTKRDIDICKIYHRRECEWREVFGTID